MLASNHGMVVAVSEDGDGIKHLVLDGSTLPANLLARSATLRGLLDLDGDAPLPILPEDFTLWSQFSSAKKYDVKGLSTIIEVAAFLDDQGACTVAAERLAVVLRKAYRKDLRVTAGYSSGQHTTVVFPQTIPTEAGSSLLKAVASISMLTPRAVIALLPHLTFCEALVLPAPFPALALEHYVARNNGILDLSPPRVPAYAPRTLQSLCELLSPLLQTSPPLTALHIPAPCLHSLETISSLTSSLSTITRLCITHGKVDYDGLDSAASLRLSVVSALLDKLSPSTLRHLSIAGPLKASTGDPDITRRLSSFTALTSLRMPVPQHQHSSFLSQLCSLPTLSSLCTLSITHAQPSATAPATCATLPALTRLHACGSTAGVAQVAGVLTSPAAAAQLSELRELSLISRSDNGLMPGTEHADDFTAAAAAFTGLPHADALLLADTPAPPEACRTLSAAGVLHKSTSIQPKDAPRLQNFWQILPHDEDQVRSAGALLAAAPSMRAATLITQFAHGPEMEALKRVVEAALVGPAPLRALCVLRGAEIVPHSAVWRSLREHDGIRRGAPSCGWVTSRRLGVAHPICALEMLHDEGGAEGDGDTLEDGEGAPGLRTLRVTASDFDPLVQPVLESGKARTAALTDLSVITQPQDGFFKPPDLRGVAQLTALRTLALAGCGSVCGTAEALHPLTALTALALDGSDDDRDLLPELGGYLLTFRGLQRLEVDVQYDSSLANAPADLSDWEDEEVSPLSGGELDGIAAEFWDGVWGALLELPLRLGARVSFYVITMDGSDFGL